MGCTVVPTRIGFGLDDTPDEHLPVDLVDDEFAKEFAGDLGRWALVETPVESMRLGKKLTASHG